MERKELNNQPAKLIKFTDGKQEVVKEGTRGECWNHRAQAQFSYHMRPEHLFVVLK